MVWDSEDNRNLHVVVGHSRNHNSPVEWAAHLPPGGWHLPTRRKVRQDPQLLVLQDEQRVEQRRERLLELLVEQLPEILAIQLREQLRIQVKVKLKTEVQTHVLVQVATQLKTPLPVLPGELLRVLLGTQERFFLGTGLGGCEAAGCRSRARPLLNVGVTIQPSAFIRG